MKISTVSVHYLTIYIHDMNLPILLPDIQILLIFCLRVTNTQAKTHLRVRYYVESLKDMKQS